MLTYTRYIGVRLIPYMIHQFLRQELYLVSVVQQSISLTSELTYALHHCTVRWFPSGSPARNECTVILSMQQQRRQQQSYILRYVAFSLFSNDEMPELFSVMSTARDVGDGPMGTCSL